MLNLFDPVLGDLAASPLTLAPRRYGLVAACDGGLLEISGLSVPVGALCRVSHGTNVTLTAEVIGFRNGLRHQRAIAQVHARILGWGTGTMKCPPCARYASCCAMISSAKFQASMST